MAYSDSGESFFENNNFDFVNDENSNSVDSRMRPDINSLNVTLWNKEVKLGETIDGLVKFGVSDYLPEGQVYLYYSIREKSQYSLMNSSKISRKYNVGSVIGKVNPPKSVSGKDEKTTTEKKHSNKLQLNENNSNSDDKPILWDNNEENEILGNENMKNMSLEANNIIGHNSSNKVDRLKKNQIKPMDEKLKNTISNINLNGTRFNKYLNKDQERRFLQQEYLAESIIYVLENKTSKIDLKTMKNSQETRSSSDGGTIFFEKLIKVFNIHNPINKSSLLFLPFRISLLDQKDLLCSADICFELSDSKESIRVSGISDYFQISLIHNIKFVFIPTETVRRCYGFKSLNSEIKLSDIDLHIFKSLLLNLEGDSNIISDEVDFKVIPNIDEQIKIPFYHKMQLKSRITKCMCIPIPASFKLSLSIDRTIVNDKMKHVNVSFRYPVRMVGSFNYLEIVLLLKFSSKVKSQIFKELIMLCEYVDLRKKYSVKNSRYNEFVHKFSLEKIRNMNFHTVEVNLLGY